MTSDFLDREGHGVEKFGKGLKGLGKDIKELRKNGQRLEDEVESTFGGDGWVETEIHTQTHTHPNGKSGNGSVKKPTPTPTSHPSPSPRARGKKSTPYQTSVKRTEYFERNPFVKLRAMMEDIKAKGSGSGSGSGPQPIISTSTETKNIKTPDGGFVKTTTTTMRSNMTRTFEEDEDGNEKVEGGFVVGELEGGDGEGEGGD